MVNKEGYLTKDCPNEQSYPSFKWTINGEPCADERYFRFARIHLSDNEIKKVTWDGKTL